jgi:ABC-type spermidine/putrescine transport system permease subunit II
MDLGASPVRALRHVLLPLLSPATIMLVSSLVAITLGSASTAA